MSTDFEAMAKKGGSFIATSESLTEYKHWLMTEAACVKCGEKYANSKAEVWLTETLCGPCGGIPNEA